MKDIVSSGKLERKLDTFSERQRKKIFSKVIAIQLTEGCSTGCTDCGLGALRNVRDYIPYDIVADIFSQYGSQLEDRVPALYFASEPFDYEFNGKDYFEIHASFQKNTGENPCVITSIPKGKEELIFSYIFGDNTFNRMSFINDVSLTKFNYKRVEQKMMELPYFKEQKKCAGEYSVELPNGTKIHACERRVNLKDVANKMAASPFRDFGFRDYVNLRDRIDFNLENTSFKKVGGISSKEGFVITPQEIYYKKNHAPNKKFPFGFSLHEVTTKNIFLTHLKLKIFDLTKYIKLI